MTRAGHVGMADQGGEALRCLSSTVPSTPPQLPPRLYLLPVPGRCVRQAPSSCCPVGGLACPGILWALSELLLWLLNETHAQRCPRVLPLSFSDKLATLPHPPTTLRASGAPSLIPGQALASLTGDQDTFLPFLCQGVSPVTAGPCSSSSKMHILQLITVYLHWPWTGWTFQQTHRDLGEKIHLLYMF